MLILIIDLEKKLNVRFIYTIFISQKNLWLFHDIYLNIIEYYWNFYNSSITISETV